MSGKRSKVQASSARAASSAAFGSGFGFGQHSAFQSTSSLSCVAEQPNLSGVSDPNVVVSLRNLSKKDSITKSKAIEELQAHVRTAPSLDDAVIAAWITLYPRASIDTSRRVRQLAHMLQGSITVATTKRILPYLRSAIGPWLSGLFDNDKVVERAAKEALELAFPTPEKRHILWKKYRDSLLSHAEDAILVQTASSLSDERSTSKDEAQAKYSRVVSSAMLLLTHLIQVHERDHATREIADKLEPMIANRKLWEFAYSADPYLRKSSCALVISCAQTYEALMNWAVISASFLSKGLSADQLGSSGAYIESLLALTRIHPTIWTSEYQSKQPVSKMLIKFLSKGSQHGPELYWRCVDELVKDIPREALTSTGTRFTLEDAIAIATALREGLGSQEEPRLNLSAAWACYIDLCFWLQEQLDEAQTQESFLRSHALPVVAMYVDPTSSGVSLPPASSLELASSIMLKLAKYDLDSILIDKWNNLTDSLVMKMKLSLPSSSEDFESSQNAIVEYSSRLQRLRQRILDWIPDEISSVITLSLSKSQATLAQQAIELLKNRNGNPYSAAAFLPDGLHFFKEKLTLDSTNDLWDGSAPEVIDEAVEVLSEGNTLLQQIMAELPQDEVSVNRLYHDICHDYHAASICVDKLSRLVTRDGAANVFTQWEFDVESRHRDPLNKSQDLLQSAVIASCLKEPLAASKRGKRLLNDLISDATDVKLLDLSIQTLRPLSLLNILLSESGDSLDALPPELLELLADPPPPSASVLETKRYLLSWHLLFDHFPTASYKLREAYVASLKSSNHLPNLLDTICSIIRITDSYPVDASKFSIDTFDLSPSTDQKQVQHLSISLYYLALLYVPSLAKSWFIDQNNRIRTPLQSWTQKYISPLILWLRTFEIVILSTNSIIEGLITFRRNVAGAIKGQGECAICYSVIGSDMQTPNKKCGFQDSMK
ncbi:hypothetical protein DV737_g4788, partial [Chaetothyriales sp. CBS 132003]